VFKKLLALAAFLTLAVPASAEAAECLGRQAEVIKRNGSVSLARYQTVLLTGSRVNVSAAGDNRVCSTDGDVKLIFGKGKQNRAALGSGNDVVTISSKANGNFIDLGDGNNRIKVKNKALTHSVRGGSGRDTVVIAFKSVSTLVDTGAGSDNVILKAKATRQTVSTGAGDDNVILKAKATRQTVSTGAGDDDVTLAAKATRQRVSTGLGGDRITVRRPAKTTDRSLNAGLGDDMVRILARGNTTTHLSPRKNPGGLSDTDIFSGGQSIDTVFDYFGGTQGGPNRIDGNGGTDYLHSLGSAHSEVHGGDGTDFIYSASSGAAGDRLFGDRGNDRLRADRGGSDATGAYLDPGDGDDWVYGTEGKDLIISLNGIEKVYANGGDDKIIKTGNGIGTVTGGPGEDTLSYAAHTPPGYLEYSGVFVDLGSGVSRNSKGNDRISSIERLLGSPFDDVLLADPAAPTRVDGGLGNDEITGFQRDFIDGGLGLNECEGGIQLRCDDDSPGEGDGIRPILDIGPEGVLTVISGPLSDEIEVGYDSVAGGYGISTNRPAELSRDCRPVTPNGGNRYLCPVELSQVSAGTVTTGGGDDDLKIDYSVPSSVNLVVSGGGGFDRFTGGRNREIVSQFERVSARAGNDQMNMTAGAVISGGGGSDTVKVKNPCRGGFIDTGPGNDNLIFAGAPRGVDASLVTRKLKWNTGRCATPTRVSKRVDDLEGSRYADVLTASPDRQTSLLGREGNDVFRSRNGVRDSITTGGGRRGDKVYADEKDKVIWGWGLAAF
jgi:Ca2+-binding RTX toxin-like protein